MSLPDARISRQEFLGFILGSEGSEDAEDIIPIALTLVDKNIDETTLLGLDEWWKLIDEGLSIIKANTFKKNTTVWIVKAEDINFLVDLLGRISQVAKALCIFNYSLEIHRQPTTTQDPELHIKKYFGNKKPTNPLCKSRLTVSYAVAPSGFAARTIDLEIEIEIEADAALTTTLSTLTSIILGLYFESIFVNQPGTQIYSNPPEQSFA